MESGVQEVLHPLISTLEYQELPPSLVGSSLQDSIDSLLS